MSENSGKRVAWIVLTIFVAAAIVGGMYWFKSTRPKPVIAKPLATVGVGLYMMRDDETGKFKITRVFQNSPADKAGIVPGFFLDKVDGHVAFTNNIRQLSKLLMGPIGSKVTLELSDTNGQVTQVDVLRAQFLNRSHAAAP